MFTTVNEKVIQNLILNANKSIVYIAPGITCIISEAIVKIREKIGIENIEIIIDSDPEVCRLGYGEISGVDLLINMGFDLKKVNSIRFGILIVDSEAILYSPTPLIIENEYSIKINAIKITIEQANVLLQEIKGSSQEKDDKIQISIFDNENAIFVPVNYSETDLEVAKVNLEERPPKKFDLERKVQVYKSYFQFVELSLIDIHFNRRTVTIPSKLLAVSGEKEVQEKLKTTYRLINENSLISGKKIEEKVAHLRKTYTRSMGKRLGTVILVSNKEEFTAKVNEIESEIENFSQTVKEKLHEELNNTKSEICNILLPGIMENPPEELRGGISTSKPKEKVARQYIEDEMDKILPNVDGYINKMELYCDFKDVTYEMLNDSDFQSNLLKQFPYLELTLPYEDFEAVGVKS